MTHAPNNVVGTFSHTTTAVINRKWTDVTARSITRDLSTLTSHIETLSRWRDNVEQHLFQSKQDMAAVNKKSDLLMGVILPTRIGAGASNVEATAATTMHTSSPPPGADSNISGEKRNADHVASGALDIRCSTLGAFEEVCRAFQIGSH